MNRERLLFNNLEYHYQPLDAAIHLARYQIARSLAKDKYVLDIACGEGYGSWLLKQWGAARVVGVDIHSESIQNAQKIFLHEDISFRCDNAETMTLDEKFDLIVSFETIEHVADPAAYLTQLKSCLAPDGILIISCPNDYRCWPPNESNPYHLRKYTLQEFIASCELILGPPSTVLIGSNIYGYGNYNMDLTDDTIHWKKASLLPHDIISLTSADATMCYNLADQLPNAKECLYYVGLWGLNELPNQTAAVFPIQPIMTSPAKIDHTIALLRNNEQTLRNKIQSLDEGFVQLHNNEKTLRSYIHDLEQALTILKKDNELFKPQSYHPNNTGPQINKSGKIFEQLYQHGYFALQPHCNNKIVLDVGCGDGTGSALLSSFGAQKVIGVDLNVSHISKAKTQYKHLNIDFHVGNCEQIINLFEEEKFDLIVVNQTLEHVIDKEPCLIGLKQLLAPGGACVISCANYTKIPTAITALSGYDSTQLIDDVTRIFGENIRVFYSYPGFGTVHYEAKQPLPSLQSHITISPPLHSQQFLMCTVVYDESQQINASAYLNIVDLDSWAQIISHDILSELKYERRIFELQQQALLAQGVILENQLLQQKITEHQQIIAAQKKGLQGAQQLALTYSKRLTKAIQYGATQLRRHLKHYFCIKNRLK